MKTDTFLSLVKATANIPTSQSTFTDEEILNFASDEMRNKITPLLLSVREEYFVYESDIALVANQSGYAIPNRAIGMKLREVQCLDSNGNICNLPRLDIENISALDASVSGTPSGFYLRGNKVILWPTPSISSGSLRLTYFRRPNFLVPTSKGSQIDAINTSTNVVTVASIGDSQIVTGAKVDFQSGDAFYESLGDDYTISALSGSDLTFSSLPSDLSIGDWLHFRDTTSLIQIPEDITGLLVARTIMRVFESQGDSDGIKIIQGRIKQLEQDIFDVITPRVEGEPKKVSSIQNIKHFI